MLQTIQARQRELDTLSLGTTMASLAADTTEHQTRGSEDKTFYGRKLAGPLTARLADALEEHILESEIRAGGGRHTGFLAALHGVPVDINTVAFLTVRTVLSQLTGDDVPLTRTAIKVGAIIQDELNANELKAEAPQLMRTLTRDLNSRTGSEGHRRIALKASVKAAEVSVTEWSTKTRLQVGLSLIELLRISTGIVDIRHIRSRDRTPAMIVATDQFTNILNEGRLAADLIPMYLPTVVEPTPWTSLTGGGYSYGGKALPFVKGVNLKTYAEEVQASRDAEPKTSTEDTMLAALKDIRDNHGRFVEISIATRSTRTAQQYHDACNDLRHNTREDGTINYASTRAITDDVIAGSPEHFYDFNTCPTPQLEAEETVQTTNHFNQAVCLVTAWTQLNRIGTARPHQLAA